MKKTLFIYLLFITLLNSQSSYLEWFKNAESHLVNHEFQKSIEAANSALKFKPQDPIARALIMP